jgi:hypothetical protein
MITIFVQICGDHWLNPQQVHEQLRLGHDQVIMDMNSEGASMTALGIADMIDRYYQPHQVWVQHWPNAIDPVDYRRCGRYFYSHFFPLAHRYWQHDLLPSTHEHRFGLFLGRRTLPRLRMLHDMITNHSGHTLFSLMPGGSLPSAVGTDLERLQEWTLGSDFEHWIQDPGVASLDNHRVQDQYLPENNTNLSLLGHYHRFDIEIVCETYCRGPCFFPTEKTVRPLLFHKPIMVYGPRHFLHNLRSQGFRTWNSVWDESYDELEGLPRWQAMRGQIDLLASHTNFSQLLAEMQDILTHNQQRARAIGHRHAPQ